MGLLDKIKNALFEVEYVEVEEKPKKNKNIQKSENTMENTGEKAIAKKIILPGNKEEKIEELHEVELEDQDFEIRPKDENIKNVFKDNYNVMEDDDFSVPEEPKVVQEDVVAAPVEDRNNAYQEVQQEVRQEVVTPYAEKDYVKEYDSYREKVNNSLYDDYHVKTRESRPYGMDPSYQISIKEYGTENREEKSYFKPSPIISPIYGILDKNYKKEDVVAKKEIRLTTSYSKSNMNVDDIRNKAYGRRSSITPQAEIETTPKKIEPPSFEVEEDDNLLVDLSDEKKPEVKEITVGDAIEYYQDLGLEYNVDYVDASNKNMPKPKPDDLEEEIKDNMSGKLEEKTPIEDEAIVHEEKPEDEDKTIQEETPIVEEKNEDNEDDASEDDASEDDDNLFDLIDSMYRDEDS